jgi:hypothetical protein
MAFNLIRETTSTASSMPNNGLTYAAFEKLLKFIDAKKTSHQVETLFELLDFNMDTHLGYATQFIGLV